MPTTKDIRKAQVLVRDGIIYIQHKAEKREVQSNKKDSILTGVLGEVLGLLKEEGLI